MAQQQQEEEGWPLGLRPLNARVGLLRNPEFNNGSISFTTTTVLTRSPSSTTDSSSALDTESTGSFFHDKSITLGSLIGFSNILELSRRSIRGRGGRSDSLREHHRYSNHNNNRFKPKPWMIFSLCSKHSTDAVNSTTNNSKIQPPCLGHLLEEERRAAIANSSTVSRSPLVALYYNDFSPPIATGSMNSLFVGDEIAPQMPPSNIASCSTALLEHDDAEHGSLLLLSCLCGKIIE
ncbi:Uncharacterized protein At3g17950 [Linum perenne]